MLPLPVTVDVGATHCCAGDKLIDGLPLGLPKVTDHLSPASAVILHTAAALMRRGPVTLYVPPIAAATSKGPSRTVSELRSEDSTALQRPSIVSG